MNMDVAGSAASFFINDHSWYRFVTPFDYVRAGLWCFSNLAIAVAYFVLPLEIRHWRVALPFRSTALLGTLFIGFIGFCGLSHLSMLFIMQTGPWWATLIVYLPTGIISLATAAVVRRERRLIVAALEGVSAALAEAGQ
ncbi:MAG TPA: hypothetical protein VMU01_06220 [Rhizomicrobium sp.]|nr:hypothetical protein [Rhizomicrobium sp.]